MSVIRHLPIIAGLCAAALVLAPAVAAAQATIEQGAGRRTDETPAQRRRENSSEQKPDDARRSAEARIKAASALPPVRYTLPKDQRPQAEDPVPARGKDDPRSKEELKDPGG